MCCMPRSSRQVFSEATKRMERMDNGKIQAWHHVTCSFLGEVTALSFIQSGQPAYLNDRGYKNSKNTENVYSVLTMTSSANLSRLGVNHEEFTYRERWGYENVDLQATRHPSTASKYAAGSAHASLHSVPKTSTFLSSVSSLPSRQWGQIWRRTAGFCVRTA